MRHRTNLTIGIMVLGYLQLSGCATLPNEAITLSQTVGNDIAQLHAGYRASVRSSFENMRKAGLAVIDYRWTPIYLSDFSRESGLVQLAQLAPPDNMEALDYWVRTAIRRIDERRQQFLEPLNQREQILLAQIDEAFSRTINANATVTGLIKSAVRVRNVQDEVLEAAGVLDLRNTINEGIIEASDFVAEVTKDIEDAARTLEEAN